MTTSEITFVYLGARLPKYAKSALQLAVKNSGLKVTFLGTDSIIKCLKIDGVKIVRVEDFYDPSHFNEIAKIISLPHDFRDGFWLKTLERFFVINQYMKSFSIEKIFHSELDQLLFGCDVLVHKLDNLSYLGIFAPFHGLEKVIGSVFYCNKISALDSFIDFLKNSKSYENEMRLFAEWGKLNPNNIFALPTVNSENLTRDQLASLGIKSFSAEDLGGVVDAAQIGQWVGGEDPRNIPIWLKPKNKCIIKDTENILTEIQLNKLKLEFKSNREVLFSLEEKISTRLYNLHLHSKIHSWVIKSPKNLKKLIDLNNSSDKVTLPSTRRIQINSFVMSAYKSVKKDPRNFVVRQFAKILLPKKYY